MVGRGTLLAGLFVVAALILFGLAWFAFLSPARPEGFAWYLFSFAMGLTMIVLPCTLPLAFVIVPLSMGKGVVKGLGMALSFGGGVAVTLSLYGVAAALLGGAAVDSLGAPLESVKNWVYFIAGIFALLFALGELGLLKVKMPSYTGAAPAFIQKRGDYLKAFLLGLFLGNIGVGCPHPATPLILIEIATNGDVLYGWTLFLVHAIGRILPLLFLAFLGILGVNGLSWVVARRERIARATGWAMVFVAGFILTLGLFTHDWWVNSGIHTTLESITGEERFLGIVSEKIGAEAPHAHGLEEGEGLFGLPLFLGNWFLVLIFAVPIWWWWLRERRRANALPEGSPGLSEREETKRVVRTRGLFFAAVTVLLFIIFVYVFPTKFLREIEREGADGHGLPQMMEEMGEVEGVGMTTEMEEVMEEHMGEDDHTEDASSGEAVFHREREVTEGLVVNFSPLPARPNPSDPVRLQFRVRKLPGGGAVDDLDIEHEKEMHVIGVREDLEGFLHIHPKKEEPGLFVTEGRFNEHGRYFLWSEVHRGRERGVTHTFAHEPFTVGTLETVTTEKATPEFLRNVIVDEEFQVALNYRQPVVAGRETRFTFTVSGLYGGGVVLLPYLGEPLHLVVIKGDRSVFLHTHPEGESHGHETLLPLVPYAYAHGGIEDEHESEPVSFSLTFPSAGVYKLFAQFRPEGSDLPEGQSEIAEFYVSVSEGSVGVDTSVFFSEMFRSPWVRFIGAAVFIVLLSLGIRRFLGSSGV